MFAQIRDTNDPSSSAWHVPLFDVSPASAPSFMPQPLRLGGSLYGRGQSSSEIQSASPGGNSPKLPSLEAAALNRPPDLAGTLERRPRYRAADDIPPYFFCASPKHMSLLMRDPVICEDGYSYERQVLQDHLRFRRTSPKTGNPLGSTKFFPNRLLAAAIKRRAQHINLHGNGPTAAYYCYLPPRGSKPFTQPVVLSDGVTYDMPQVKRWLNGRRVSPSDNQTQLRDWELLIPNRAVCQMVYDAGYPMPKMIDFAEKVNIWSTPHRFSCDDTILACAGGGLLGINGGVIALAVMQACGVVIPHQAYLAIACSGGFSGWFAGLLVSTCYGYRRKQVEEARFGGTHKFTGP